MSKWKGKFRILLSTWMMDVSTPITVKYSKTASVLNFHSLIQHCDANFRRRWMKICLLMLLIVWIYTFVNSFKRFVYVRRKWGRWSWLMIWIFSFILLSLKNWWRWAQKFFFSTHQKKGNGNYADIVDMVSDEKKK